MICSHNAKPGKCLIPNCRNIVWDFSNTKYLSKGPDGKHYTKSDAPKGFYCCNQCKEIKEDKYFHKCSRSIRGYKTICKLCVKSNDRIRNQNVGLRQRKNYGSSRSLSK